MINLTSESITDINKSPQNGLNLNLLLQEGSDPSVRVASVFPQRGNQLIVCVCVCVCVWSVASCVRTDKWILTDNQWKTRNTLFIPRALSATTCCCPDTHTHTHTHSRTRLIDKKKKKKKAGGVTASDHTQYHLTPHTPPSTSSCLYRPHAHTHTHTHTHTASFTVTETLDFSLSEQGR